MPCAAFITHFRLLQLQCKFRAENATGIACMHRRMKNGTNDLSENAVFRENHAF
jgi:hypothetical protein